MTSSSLIAIEIRMFRGESARGRPVVTDPRLDKYGHVGISLVEAAGEATVEGFNPAKPDGMSWAAFLDALAAGHAFPGRVVDDSALFQMVSKPRLREIDLRLDAATCLEIKRRLEADRGGQPMGHKMYAFPARSGGGFAPGTMNCVTYPLSLGMPPTLYPYAHGRLGAIIAKDEVLIIKYLCG